MKIGIIAGGGDLPHAVIAGANEAGHEVFIALVNDLSQPEN